MTSALVIGAGPAGLMAADILSARGVAVTLAEAMPSVGRKFLMAGKTGLNLTKDEPLDAFLTHYSECPPVLARALRAFGPQEAMRWAGDLGQEVFTGTSGRVFPISMKASPLLRSWMGRLGRQSVALHTRWRWQGFEAGTCLFDSPMGRQSLSPDIVILALGGASWRKLGSDGLWVDALPSDAVAPFRPANVGLTVDWSPFMERHFGAPVKGCALVVGRLVERGEFVVSARGLEGSGIYGVSRLVREGAPFVLDLFPDQSEAALREKLRRSKQKSSLANHLRKTVGLDGVRVALLLEWGRPLGDDIAPLLKALPVRHNGPRPINEAISTAGGVRFEAVDTGLMLKSRPGVFCAGEMLDWEAPTGGYLITACLATGQHAALSALEWAGIG